VHSIGQIKWAGESILVGADWWTGWRRGDGRWRLAGALCRGRLAYIPSQRRRLSPRPVRGVNKPVDL